MLNILAEIRTEYRMPNERIWKTAFDRQTDRRILRVSGNYT